MPDLGPLRADQFGRVSTPSVEGLRIHAVIPSYRDCPDLPRCLHYLRIAEDYARRYEPTWTISHEVIYGERVGDGTTWSAPRDREIARCRDLGLHAGADRADWALMMDADLLVPENLHVILFNLRPDVGAKTIRVWNAEVGTYRFVDKDFHGQYIDQIGSDRFVWRASELLAVRADVVNRLPRPFYRPENLNEDYELCDRLRDLGVRIYCAPVDGIAT